MKGLKKIVAVRHHSYDANVWWFHVPEALFNHIKCGCNVICDTKYGNATGKVESEFIYDGEFSAPEIINENENGKITKSILAVQQQSYIGFLDIPECFKKSPPSTETISKHLSIYYKYGKLDNNIVITPRGTLVDGYASYLVLKMFDISEASIYVADSESKWFYKEYHDILGDYDKRKLKTDHKRYIEINQDEEDESIF